MTNARQPPAASPSHANAERSAITTRRETSAQDRLQKPPTAIMRLQRDAGNRATTELLQRLRAVSDDALRGDVMAVGRRAPGHALEPSVLTEMQSHLGQDLGRVRIHTDAQTAASARAMGAAAYTVGHHVSFAAGKYAPHTESGRKLLAHELTHYVQQAGSARARTRSSSAVSPIAATPSPRPENSVSVPSPGHRQAAEIEADYNAERIASGVPAQVNVAAPIGVAMKNEGDDPAAARSFWFQNKAPQKPIQTAAGIEIAPKGQVVVDPAIQTIRTSRGSFRVRFAGLDSDFPGGKRTATFADAEQAVTAAITGVIEDLEALPDIKGAESMKAALAQREADETVRARLLEAERTLHGKTLNIFIATELTVAERMSLAGLSFRTEQIFVRADDIGDPMKLEAAIRVPLVTLTGGELGIAPGPGGELQETSVRALTTEQAKEGLLHEMVHVLLINKGLSAAQIWGGAKAGLVTGPNDVKRVAEDVLFRYLRAQEEIFVYSAIESMYGFFAARNKGKYELLAKKVEAFLKSAGAKLAVQKPVKIDVAGKIGEDKKKKSVTWSIMYTMPQAVNVDAAHLDTLKALQSSDIGS